MGLTRGADARFKRDLAIWGVLFASALCAFVALAGGALLGKYRISLDAVRIAGGLVLLIAALQTIFRKAPPPDAASGAPRAIQLAAAPLAVPGIVPPAGIAAILIFMLLAPQYPGMGQAVTIALMIVMALDLLVMAFIDWVLKIPGLGPVLTVLGSVLVFVQASLAIQMMVAALKSLGIVNV